MLLMIMILYDNGHFYFFIIFLLLKVLVKNKVLKEKNANRAFFIDYTVNVQVELWYLSIIAQSRP